MSGMPGGLNGLKLLLRTKLRALTSLTTGSVGGEADHHSYLVCCGFCSSRNIATQPLGVHEPGSLQPLFSSPARGRIDGRQLTEIRTKRSPLLDALARDLSDSQYPALLDRILAYADLLKLGVCLITTNSNERLSVLEDSVYFQQWTEFPGLCKSALSE